MDRAFVAWKEATGHARARLTRERRQKAEARLREGYTEQDLIDASRGILLSPHHAGRNDTGTVYDDFDVVCKSGKNIERFRDLARGEIQLAPENETDRRVAGMLLGAG